MWLQSRHRASIILFTTCWIILASSDALSHSPHQAAQGGDERPRIRDLGVSPGVLSTGPLNAITDVEGVLVGHVSIVERPSVNTGVTAILPHGRNLFQDKVPAAVHVANAFGKAAGFLQVQELGQIETPIVLTNTLSVGTALEAVVRWTLDQPGNEQVRSVNAVVGETNDGYLNDIRSPNVSAHHVVSAIEQASGGPVKEGAVGAGRGTIAFGFKGGIGTASRQLPESLSGATVGVLVQSNFGGLLTIDGRRVGERLERYSYRRQLEEARSTEEPTSGRDPSRQGPDNADGSVMIVVATDAPLDARQLGRLARRAPLGLARTGSFISHGSGDFVVAFSTTASPPGSAQAVPILDEGQLSPLFLAVVEATEEAVYNSIVRARTVVGHRGTIEALPLAELERILGTAPESRP